MKPEYDFSAARKNPYAKGGPQVDQTDIQFKAFLCSLLLALQEISAEKDDTKRTEKMNKVINNLQKVLED